jgi:hypothetical protein
VPPAPVVAPAPPAPATALVPAPAPREPSAAQDREAAVTVALAFLDALVRRDPAGLVQASGARFSFDGEVVEGRDAQRRRWRDLLSARPVATEALRDLALLDSAEATARLGPPPARIAPLVRPGAWIAIGDVSGRPVVLVIVREGARLVVAALND